MTQRTINLYDGLEALYYFDSDYFDGTTGEIKDKSGHGRHAKAFGGPTVGVNGPNDFEAASLDGNDDKFNSQSKSPALTEDFTAATLVKTPSDISGREVHTSLGSGSDFINMGIRSGDLRAELRDKNTGYSKIDISAETNTVYLHVIIYDSSNSIYRVMVSERRTKVEKDVTFQATPRPVVHGSRADSNAHWSGNISFGGVWSRQLSIAGIKKLNDLTAPRRSML